MKINSNLISSENYSTNEEIVGKWIDGKPIYRKVIPISARTINYSSNGWSLTAATISNFDKLIRSEGTIITSSGTRKPIGQNGWNALKANLSFINQFWIEVSSNGNVYLYSVFGSSNGNSMVIQDSYIILEYTKTTD